MSRPAPKPDAGVVSGSFPANHPWDRNFHLVILAVACVGILMSFGGEISRHVAENRASYPFITHVHAVVFMGWLVLFTVQSLLVRWRKLKVHRQLGLAMAGVAVVMLFLGPATALHKQHLTMNQPNADPAFLSVQLTDMLAFGGLIAVGLARRNDAHRRLMLLGTLYITDAGFARWLGDSLAALGGDGMLGLWAALYVPTTVLMLSLGAYDLATRHRLHPAWIGGIFWVAANQATALFLYQTPWWTDIAQAKTRGQKRGLTLRHDGSYLMSDTGRRIERINFDPRRTGPASLSAN